MLGDIHQELIQLGPHLLVHSKAGVEVFIIPERLILFCTMEAGLIWVADALGILDVVVTSFVNGDEGLGILDILHVEHQILGPFQLAGELDVIAGEQDAAVELVPEHTVKSRRRACPSPQGKGVLVVDPGGQETVFPHLRGPGNTITPRLSSSFSSTCSGFVALAGSPSCRARSQGLRGARRSTRCWVKSGSM